VSNRFSVVIFLGKPERAAELAGHLQDEQYVVHVADNTDELYRLANSESIDLIIIDNQLPGFLSGIELLERLHTDLMRPTTLLIGVANPKLNERVAALGIATLVSPTAGSTEIAAIADKALLVESIDQVTIHAKARALVQDADFIRPLSQLAVKYASQLHEASCPIDELARDVSVDPKMTAVLLKLTNSASLGVRVKITRAFDAVTLLGIRRTISLILSSSFSNAQCGLASNLPQPFRKWYFDRSVLTAGAAVAIARRTREKSDDMAGVLGLLQDIGILILAYRYADVYLGLVNRVRQVGLLRLEIVEQQEFGITHSDVSAALLSKWGLPQPLIKLVAQHHRPDREAKLSTSEARLLLLMRAGEAFANLADNRTAPRSQHFNQLLAELGMSSADQIKLCMAEAIAKAVESAKLLSIPTSEEGALRRLVA